MESQSNHRLEQQEEDVSKSSSEEEAEGLNDDLGTGRSYECVFCKRGFTTAQALGGHMNIHRKERGAKPRPTSAPTSVASEPADVSDLVRTYRSLQSYTGGPHFAIAPEVERNYRTYVPAPTWVIAPTNSDHDEFCSRNYPLRHHPNLFATDDDDDDEDDDDDDDDDDGRNWRSGSGLSLGIGPSAQGSDDDEHLGHDHQRKAMDGVRGGCSSEGDGLDLELRLGHDP